MGSRSDWLTDFAKPVADTLAERCGSLKRVLSAGIMALNDLSPEGREYYMAKAVGKTINEQSQTKITTVRQILREMVERMKAEKPIEGQVIKLEPEERSLLHKLDKILVIENEKKKA